MVCLVRIVLETGGMPEIHSTDLKFPSCIEVFTVNKCKKRSIEFRLFAKT